MNETNGNKTLKAIPSKSDAHRAIICSALAGGKTRILCEETSVDIEATKDCMKALMDPSTANTGADLYCRESGSTLRFLLPVVGALGKRGIFHPMGRLPKRPLSPLRDELIEHGMKISQQGSVPLIAEGKLKSGEYRMPGNISSQFVSGLLFALPLVDGDSKIIVGGVFQSAAYTDMTIKTLKEFGINIETEKNNDSTVFIIPGNQQYMDIKEYRVEGDWSNSAFWLAAGIIGKYPIKVEGLDINSAQGDKAIVEVIRSFGGKVEINDDGVTAYPENNLSGITYDAGQTPDMIPVVALIGTQAKGTTKIVNAGRLRTKESDRLHSITVTLRSLGADVEEMEDSLIINNRKKIPELTGGTVESFDDHRIAMMASIASILTKDKVNIIGWEAVSKSYPSFYERLEELNLDGNIERV